MAPKPRAPRPFARALLHTQPDERLVDLAREGREAAFEEIVRRYRAPLVAFAAAYAPADRAEDVVQESFERSWTALRQSDREIHLKPWLYAIVRNGALNARRGVRYDKPLDESVDGVRRPEEIVLERAELARVVAAIGALPDAQREALVRSALDGRTHEQIADVLGTTPGSVRGLIHRARTAVRNGAGAMLPLPLVRLLTESGTAEAGAGAAAAAAAGGTGVSLLAKGATVATIGALAIGSGVAIDRANRDGGSPDPERARVASESGSERGGDRRGSVDTTPAPVSDSGPGGGTSGGSGSGSDDSSGRGSGASGGDDGGGSEGPSANAGSGSSGSGSGSSGSGSDDFEDEARDAAEDAADDAADQAEEAAEEAAEAAEEVAEDQEEAAEEAEEAAEEAAEAGSDSSGSATSGSGSSGSGTSGSLASGSGTSGSGSSGSGTSGSDSSGSGG